MSDFPHLPLPQNYSGQYKHKGQKFEKVISPVTLANRTQRRIHGRLLKGNANRLISDWGTKSLERKIEELPDLPNPSVIPIFLKVDTALFKADSLYSFGIEVIAEEEDGFIIGASSDNFTSLKNKIDKFIAQQGTYKNKAAELWEIAIGDQWRLEYILSESLSQRWDQIADTEELIVDISIACTIKIPDEPNRITTESHKKYDQRYAAWQERKNRLEVQRDELEMQRQDDFDEFLGKFSEGDVERISGYVGYEDSFSCRIRLKGYVLKDLVRNYQYLFDACEYDTLRFISPSTGDELDINVDFTTSANSPEICIIDSGIQEGHKLISHAIDTQSSTSFIPGDASVADAVANGGHGTKVCGGALFGNNIPKIGSFNFDIRIQNARILNPRNLLPSVIYPPLLMETIVNNFNNCKIFNLSVNSNRACKTTHMSQWATTIDKLMFEDDKLFIISSGNVDAETTNLANPGVKEHLLQGRNYPDYLLTNASRIANPAQSCFALTVGSVCINKYEDPDKISFGDKNDPSAFTRTGPGIWKMIKPDVVEYGGDFIREKLHNPNISVLPITSIEVIKTTNNGGNALGFDVGTSFAAPKVSYIAGKIINAIPTATSNLIRALISQSARLPFDKYRTPATNDIRIYGYGIPDIVRATQNSESRITLIGEAKISPKIAQIYTVKIPKEINRTGNEYEVLVEVCLAYMAKPRRTRRKTNSYLSSWLDWKSSKFDESLGQFKTRVTKYVDGEETEQETDSESNIRWAIRENKNWGSVKDFRRQDSALQKDWAIINAYNLPDEISIAVIGHKGWEKDISIKIPYAITVSFEVLGASIEIYNKIKVENKIEVEHEIRLNG